MNDGTVVYDIKHTTAYETTDGERFHDWDQAVKHARFLRVRAFILQDNPDTRDEDDLAKWLLDNRNMLKSLLVD